MRIPDVAGEDIELVANRSVEGVEPAPGIE
jgi:hypothetical protein